MSVNDKRVRNDAVFARIFRDMEEAVFVIEYDGGSITYVNERCEKLLGFGCGIGDGKPQKYVDLMSRDGDSRNDDFHQMILDSVYDIHNVHRRNVSFYKDGKRMTLNLRTSFLRDEDGGEPIGIVAVIEDVTEISKLQRKKKNSNIVFALFVALLCLIIFMVQGVTDFNAPITKPQITIIIEVMALVFMLILMKTTHLNIKDMGFRKDNLKPTLISCAVIVPVLFALLTGFKLVLTRLSPGFFPPETPFFASLPISEYITYLFTAFIQELIARGVVQSSLNRVFDGKNGQTVALIISALAFGTIHLYYGFLFMLMASALVGVLGIMFNKQKNIWGVTLIHYALGMAAGVLGFL